MSRLLVELIEAGPQSSRETSSQRDRLGAGANPVLLPTSRGDWMHLDSPADPECPDPDGSTDLVCGEGRQVHSPLVEVHRDMAKGLNGVGVHEGSDPMGLFGDLVNGLACAGLVVDGYHRDDVEVAAQWARSNRIRVHDSRVVDREHPHPLAEQPWQRHRTDGGMLHCRDQCVAMTGRSHNAQHVGLCSSAGEHDLQRTRSEQAGDLLSRILQQSPRRAA